MLFVNVYIARKHFELNNANSESSFDENLTELLTKTRVRSQKQISQKMMQYLLKRKNIMFFFNQ